MLYLVMQAIILVVLIAIASIILPVFAFNSSNHFKSCMKIHDKSIRSIICPDIFNSNETTVKLYG